MTLFQPLTYGLDWTVHLYGFILTNEQMEWCDEWFSSPYSNTFMSGSATTVWFFKDRKEAIRFALTWK